MGGKDLLERERYEALFQKVIAYVCVFVPIGTILYAELTQLLLVPRSVWYDPQVTLGFCILLFFVALAQYINIKRPFMKVISPAWQLLIAHAIAGLTLFFISGILSPLTILWVILVYISHLFHGRMGLFLSASALTATSTLYMMLAQPDTLRVYVMSIMYVVIIVSSGAFFAVMRSVQSNEHNDLVRSQLREKQQHSRLLTIINSVDQAIISLDARGIVQTYNAATLNLLDTNESLGGKKIDTIFHVQTADGSPIKLLDKLRTSDRMTEDDTLSHTFVDGESIRLSVTWTAIKNSIDTDQIDGYIVVIRDITKAKSLAEERDEFISVVSHELRTPITITEGTLSNVQLFLERGTDPKKLVSAVKDAHEQIIYLAKMVNDLSTLSRADRGVGDQKEKIDVMELVTDMYNEYSPRAQKKGLHFDLDAHGRLGSVMTSRLYLEEMLQNFVTNAIKYTQSGSVTLSARRDTNKIVFSVRDSGIGIAKNEQKKIFAKFYRSEDYRTRETSGTGLGLYVVQKLAKKLDTEIQLESRLNHGSTFSFSLPIYVKQLDETEKTS